MNVTYIKPAHSDERGEITDILNHTCLDSVTTITSVPGAMRGNHFHKESHQYLYILSGRIRAYSQISGDPVEVEELGPGALWYTPPFERHALEVLEQSFFIVITRGPRQGEQYESDTYRVEPLNIPQKS